MYSEKGCHLLQCADKNQIHEMSFLLWFCIYMTMALTVTLINWRLKYKCWQQLTKTKHRNSDHIWRQEPRWDKNQLKVKRQYYLWEGKCQNEKLREWGGVVKNQWVEFPYFAASVCFVLEIILSVVFESQPSVLESLEMMISCVTDEWSIMIPCYNVWSLISLLSYFYHWVCIGHCTVLHRNEKTFVKV